MITQQINTADLHARNPDDLHGILILSSVLPVLLLKQLEVTFA
jgi:hypothetical protein